MRLLRYMLWMILTLMVGTTMAHDPLPLPERTILVMGDSLSAAHGIATEQGWVALLAQRLKAEFPDWKVVNASISGETSAGGLSRFPAELARHRPTIVILELGANDGLRGLPLRALYANLAQMVSMARDGTGAHVLVLGMLMPPNLGADYTTAFAQVYPQLIAENDAALLPFLLEPIALDRSAFQEDHLHPTAEVQSQLLEHVWPSLRPLLGCSLETPTRQCGE